MSISSNFINLIVRNVYDRDSDLSICLPSKSKVFDLKKMIQIKESSHPEPYTQKLIYQGKIPADAAVLEDIFIQDDQQNAPILHLVLSSKARSESVSSMGDSPQEKISSSPPTAPEGITYDVQSMEAAQKWLQSSSVRAVRHGHAESLVRESIRSVLQSVDDSPPASSAQANEATDTPPPVTPPVAVVGLGVPFPALVDVKVLVKVAFLALMFHRSVSDSLLAVLCVVYYVYAIGLAKYLFLRVFFSGRVPDRVGEEGEPQGVNRQPNMAMNINGWGAFASLRLPVVPRTGGAVMDVVSLLSAFVLSLLPSWNPE